MRYLSLLLIILFGMSILSGCVDSVAKRQTILPTTTTGSDDDDDDTDSEAEVRPTGAVTFKDGYCGCKAGLPTTYGDCATYCAANNTSDELFSASFSVTEAISLTKFGSVQGWCTTPLLDAEGNQQSTNASCVMNIKDDNGSETDLPLNTQAANSNSIKVNISSLDYDKTYILTLKEVTSGAKSNSVQIYRPSPTNSSVLGPLKITPVSQYSCVLRNLSQDESTGDVYYDSAYRLHFYFVESARPSAIPANVSNIFCHDIFNTTYGAVDDRTYPRLEETPGVFSLWDAVSDPRFYDNNGNDNWDVNDQIINKVKDFGYTIPSTTNFFLKFPWQTGPTIEDSSGSATTQSLLGWYMIPWVDQSTFKAYCPTSAHYNSDNVIFKAMRDIVSVDTEGLYIAMKDGELVNTGTTSTVGPNDYLLVRESDIKRAWFYLNGTTHIAPTDANVGTKTIYFYYPFNFNSPFTKTSTQKVYVVKKASELSGTVENSGTTSSTGTISTYPPHDRRIGCVPKLQ